MFNKLWQKLWDTESISFTIAYSLSCLFLCFAQQTSLKYEWTWVSMLPIFSTNIAWIFLIYSSKSAVAHLAQSTSPIFLVQIMNMHLGSPWRAMDVTAMWLVGIESKCCQCCGSHANLDLFCLRLYTVQVRTKARKTSSSDHPLPLLFYPSSLLFLSLLFSPALCSLALCYLSAVLLTWKFPEKAERQFK